MAFSFSVYTLEEVTITNVVWSYIQRQYLNNIKKERKKEERKFKFFGVGQAEQQENKVFVKKAEKEVVSRDQNKVNANIHHIYLAHAHVFHASALLLSRRSEWSWSENKMSLG